MQTITELTLEAIFDMYNNFFGSDFDNMNEFGRPVEQQDLHLDEVRFSYDSVIRLQDQVGVNCIGFRNYVGENKVFFLAHFSCQWFVPSKKPVPCFRSILLMSVHFLTPGN
jgi:hypothetical protein